MKIYSDTLTKGDLGGAALHQGLDLVQCNDLPSTRVRARGWSIALGNAASNRPFSTGQHGGAGAGAASWDDWGRFLACLYELDPAMRAACYTSREDFHAKTDGNYDPGNQITADPDQVITRRRDGIAYLNRDGDLRVPASRYGRSTSDCAPVAWRVAYLISREQGEPVRVRDLDHAMGLVVNDHDDVAWLIKTCGHGKYT